MYSGLWMFAWDLADEGIDRVMGWAADFRADGAADRGFVPRRVVRFIPTTRSVGRL